MKKKVTSWLLSIAMILSLLPGMTLTASAAEAECNCNFEYSVPVNRVNVIDINLYEHMPDGAKVLRVTIPVSNILRQCTPVWSDNSASIELQTRTFDEPCSAVFPVTVKTENHGDITFKIKVNLTGKHRVNIQALAQDALYDGNAHCGYSDLRGTLTSGGLYTGDYTCTYAKADGSPLEGPPSDIGSYKVTIAIPENNTEYKAYPLTLNFKITSEKEARYQTEEKGDWKYGTFTEALANAYAGGTIELLNDVVLSQTATVTKNVTITSNDTASPKTITFKTNNHSYLLKIAGSFAQDGETYTAANVTLKDVIVDGGNASGITASRALVAVGDNSTMKAGYLTLEKGAILRNNNNTTENGAGGGVCIIVGELTVNGGEISNNSAYQGGGIALLNLESNAVNMTAGSVSSNKAVTDGGGIYQSTGTITVSGAATIEKNTADRYGGGIYQKTAAPTFKLNGGTVSKNSASYGGGFYIDKNKLLQLSGGTVTGNDAKEWGAGMLIAPASNVEISGNFSVYGNSNGTEEPGDNMYLDGYKDKDNVIHFPNIKLGNLSDTANIVTYSWLKPVVSSELLIAKPSEEYTIKTEDMKKFSYENSAYRLKLNASGQMVLVAVTLYDVTVENGTGGGKYAAGDAVTITANTPENGKKFAGWTSKNNIIFADDSAAETTFTMPAAGVVVTATFKPIQTVTFATDKNDDGSTTTTTTNKTTGTVTETTKYPDGSSTTVETKKDGSATETTKTADGVTGTTVTDEDGDVTEITAKVPASAARDAEESGEAVTLPVEVPAANSTDEAVEIKVDVPSGGATVEIPVENVTPGTVVVIVNADGTEKVVKTSTVSETGVVVALESDATIKIVDNSQYYIDVHPVNHWAENAIDFASARGLLNGYGNGYFGPDDKLSRGMLAQILYNLEGRPAVSGEMPFTDVAEGRYYYDAICWAAANGIVVGYGNGLFGPDDNITREQLAAMLYRYEQYKGGGFTGAWMFLLDYTDRDQISEWAYEPICWMTMHGVMSGYGNKVLGPKDNATRAQVAQMLKNYLENAD